MSIYLGEKVLGTQVNGLKRIVECNNLSRETYKGHKVMANSNIRPSLRQHVDIDWLSAASTAYEISSNIKDYLIVPIPIVTTDLPNRNLQAFPMGEVTNFDPLHGKFIYQTFVGKPTHLDHKNDNPKEAKGVIFDATFHYIKAYNLGKIVILAGFDRSKDQKLCRSILSGERDSYSMGAFVTSFFCSIPGCERAYGKEGKKSCIHQLNPLIPTVQVYNGNLNYMNCRGVTYFEASSVGSGADVGAWTAANDLIDLNI